ncbi:hypothetical protein XENTR_v10016467 [Xenopus tropicalis]|nr:hypothetical protein XENTR_v10016467 [Xenopus tropicalis]
MDNDEPSTIYFYFFYRFSSFGRLLVTVLLQTVKLPISLGRYEWMDKCSLALSFFTLGIIVLQIGTLCAKG